MAIKKSSQIISLSRIWILVLYMKMQLIYHYTKSLIVKLSYFDKLHRIVSWFLPQLNHENVFFLFLFFIIAYIISNLGVLVRLNLFQRDDSDIKIMTLEKSVLKCHNSFLVRQITFGWQNTAFCYFLWLFKLFEVKQFIFKDSQIWSLNQYMSSLIIQRWIRFFTQTRLICQPL